MDKEKESKGDDCIQCHMPETTYMGIDKRADHSIRIPRPDLSPAYQLPIPAIAPDATMMKLLNGPMIICRNGMAKKRPHFGETFAQARQGNPKSLSSLISLSKNMLYPDIVRATALSLLSGYPVKESFAAIESGLSDPDALVRQTAISTINLLQFDKDAKLIFPLLYDPVKAVRIQAALGVASMQNLKLTTDQQTVFDSGIKEYVSAMEYAGDFASGRYNLALMYHAQQQAEQAIENYEQAIRIDSLFIPAMNNLAMLYNARGENEMRKNY